jgi:hypothetical protein
MGYTLRDWLGPQMVPQHSGYHQRKRERQHLGSRTWLEGDFPYTCKYGTCREPVDPLHSRISAAHPEAPTGVNGYNQSFELELSDLTCTLN